MKKVLILFLLSNAISVQAQIPGCDSLVPTYNIDFTGAAAGSTWTSPPVVRQGYCCGTVYPEICIDFIILTDNATMGLTLSGYYSPGPSGPIFFQVDCQPALTLWDTAFISTPGIHYLTFCKPGNSYCTYSITSFLNIPTSSPEISIINSVFTLFPNPTTTEVTITFGNPAHRLNGGLNVQLTNTLGEMLEQTQTNSSSHTLGMSSRPRGIYFVTVSDEAGNKTVKKIVKM